VNTTEEIEKNTKMVNEPYYQPDTSRSITKTISIFLVDDNKAFLGVASNFLSTYGHLKVEGSSTSTMHAMEEILRIQPDLVVVDLVMPELNGFETTRWIKKYCKTTRVIILSLHDYPEYRASAIAVGADEFLTKTEFANQIMNVINRFFFDGIDLR
jgi:two-component system, NarL family, nitrate/nitrite response regulator NarL